MNRTSRESVPNVHAGLPPQITESAASPGFGWRVAEADHILREHEVTRDAVVLRAELRGFTRIANQHAAAELTPLLDEYMDLLSEAVTQNGGVIYQVEGDSLTAGFGVRAKQLNGSAERALRTAQQMLARFESLAERWKERRATLAAIGIGIHEGEVLTTKVHLSDRQSEALVGDTVNVASCLSHRARAGEAVLSGTVRESLKRHGVEFQGIELAEMRIPGRSTHVDLFCLPRTERIQLNEV